jgi:lipopolysaccharide transport system ATP-binding protein
VGIFWSHWLLRLCLFSSFSASKKALPMSSDLVIRAASLGKSYRLYARPADRLWQFVWGNRKKLHNDFVALEGVSFNLLRGQVLGIVGVNGAGKSTLLQLIAGTIAPSHGKIETRGRVAALLELGSGFNPEFTGRENIYLNAAVLGLSRAEIDARLQDIIDFADIGQHIDQPVKTYSSGMHTRLAFSIATSVDADVLIVDEALSVGDGAFARKSFDRIMQIKEGGATVLFCSHVLFHIEVFCDKALWLHQGKVRALGQVTDVLSKYQEFLDDLNQPPPPAVADASSEQAASPLESVLPVPAAHPVGFARIRSVEVAMDGQVGQELYGNSGLSCLEMRIAFSSDPQLPCPSAGLVISSDGGRILATHFATSQGLVMARNATGEGVAQIRVPNLPLNKGRYRIGAYLMCEKDVHVYQWIDPVAHVQMHREGHDQGYWVLSGEWSSPSPATSN